MKRRKTVLISAAIAVAAIAVVSEHGARPRAPSCAKTGGTTNHELDRSMFPPMPALDPKMEEAFRPPNDWRPMVDLAENVVLGPSRLSEALRTAHVAKRGMKYSPEKPIRVEMQNGMIFVRFPSNSPTGAHGLKWSANVVLDAETLRPIAVYQDPN